MDGRRYFDDDGSKNYLVFQLLFENFRMLIGDTETNVAWKSKRLLHGSTKPPITQGNNLSPKLKWIHHSKVATEFKKSCLKQSKGSFTHRNVVNLIVVYELGAWSIDLNTISILGDCLFGAMKLTRLLILINMDIVVMVLALMTLTIFIANW